MSSAGEEELARVIRDACLEAAAAGYREGLRSGMCREGAFELALDAIRRQDPRHLAAMVPSRGSAATGDVRRS